MINAERVIDLFSKCLLKEDENVSDFVEVESITSTVKFDTKTIDKFKDEIEEIIFSLPDNFKKSIGGRLFIS